MRWTLLLLVVGACAGETTGAPGTSTCDGRKLTTFDENGKGTTKVCPLTCDTDHCTAAANIPIEVQTACTKTNAPEFTAVNGGEIEPDLELACVGCGSEKIQAQRIEAGDVDLAFYCLSSFDVPAGKTLTVADGIDAAIVIFVDGQAFIDGTIDIDGDDTVGGAGGFAGAAPAPDGANGKNGSGPCAGSGGATSSTNTTINIGAGGGGAGYRTTGANGGPARDAAQQNAAAGLGGAACAKESLQPLIGGSGGGGGGDGVCTGAMAATCGRPGGGGGGAIQIVSTNTVVVRGMGTIKATGGIGASVGPGDEGGGGGGGGAGGSILIQANKISLSGTLDVTGGAGGAVSTSVGGAGGTPSAMPQPGQNPLTQPAGGSGGGGASGWVRLEAAVGAICPNASCSSGSLEPAP